jgi:putative serine protease XkdF
MFLFADLIKSQPGVQSVHASTALGNGARRRRRRLVFPAFIGQTNVTKLSGRVLAPLDAERSHTPFTYDPTALGSLRQDQVPRFLGALTNPDDLPVQTVSLDHLTAIQNRVDTAKVQAWADGTIKSDKLAVVVKDGDRQLIADGHHRLSGAWLRGETTAKVRVKDISPVSNAVKRDLDWSLPLDIRKADPDQQLVFGWASVIEKGGVIVTDKQGDQIPTSAMEPAAYDFVLNSRDHGDMHEATGRGRLVESFMATHEKQAALGIDLGMVGWWTGFHVECPELWKAYRAGLRPEFSIGGSAVSREI